MRLNKGLRKRCSICFVRRKATCFSFRFCMKQHERVEALFTLKGLTPHLSPINYVLFEDFPSWESLAKAVIVIFNDLDLFINYRNTSKKTWPSRHWRTNYDAYLLLLKWLDFYPLFFWPFSYGKNKIETERPKNDWFKSSHFLLPWLWRHWKVAQF